MKVIKLTQNKETIVDDEDYEYLNQFTWCYGSKGYAICNLPRKEGKRQTLRMHRMILNCPKNKQVDHINGNPLDNRKENLRICSQKENSYNKTSKKKFKGVFWHKLNNKFTASIRYKNKQIHLGYFISAEQAAKAYDNAAKIYFGKFANLNFKD